MNHQVKTKLIIMKKLFLIVMVFGVSGAMQAQSTSLRAENSKMKERVSEISPEERAKKKTAKLTEELGLDAEQQQAVYEITLDQIVQRERTKMQREEAREQAMASRERTEQRIDEVLNEEQKAKWDAHKEEQRELRRERIEQRGESRMGSEKSDVKSTDSAKKKCSKECAKTCEDKKK